VAIVLTASSDWRSIVPIECGAGIRISVDARLPLECRRLRPEIHTMLQAAAKSLPDNCRLHIFEAFRTQERQFSLWNQRLVELAREYPREPLDELLIRCKVDIADPVGRPSGHQGGTAVDVTLFENGVPVDMGCDFADFSNHDLVATHSPLIDATQRRNRQRLSHYMEEAGFINYDQEWWHFNARNMRSGSPANRKPAPRIRVAMPTFQAEPPDTSNGRSTKAWAPSWSLLSLRSKKSLMSRTSATRYRFISCEPHRGFDFLARVRDSRREQLCALLGNQK